MNQPAHIVDQIHHADLHTSAGQTDGADKFAAHGTLLKAKHMLDPHPHLRAGFVGLDLASARRFAPPALVMDMATIGPVTV